MPWQALTLALGPLLGLFLVSLGNGFISSLTSLRLDAAGVSHGVIGYVASSYFAGLALGALFGDRLIARIGHIRAYSSFASLTAVTFLLQGMFFDPWVWLVLRLINGWAIVGIFLVVESWLLLASDKRMRGRLLAIYMVALYGSGMAGQASLGVLDAWGTSMPFMMAGMLASLSVLPMVILPRLDPQMGPVEPLLPQHLLRTTPTGFVGSFGSGIAIAAIYALLPIYLQRVGMNVTEVGHLMACVILGAMLLQYPVGRWSDRQDRQRVLIALSAACAVLSLLILLLPDSRILLAVLLFLLGGGVFALYPVAVSHSTDQAAPGELVRLIQGLLLINSVGSAISPLLISRVMDDMGTRGFFLSFLALSLGLMAFFVWRRHVHPAPHPAARFEPAAQLSPIGVEIRVTPELVHAAQEREEQDAQPAPLRA